MTTVFAPDNVLGRYLHDHLSMPVARLTDVRRKPLNRVVGFRFEGGQMRYLRFEPRPDLRAERKLPAGFAQVGFATAMPTGFDALRAVYRKLQRRERPRTRDITDLALGLPWLTRAVWWRYAEKRLLFPDGAEFDVHMVIEQEPRVDNRITLSPSRRDINGSPLAAIDWRVHDGDVINLQAMAEAFAGAWKVGPLASLARIELTMPNDPKRALAQGGGKNHPGGSVRMGRDAGRGVVDGEMRTFRVPNLSVVSTATFPAGGGANPTMMLMMAALRTADRIARQSW